MHRNGFETKGTIRELHANKQGWYVYIDYNLWYCFLFKKKIKIKKDYSLWVATCSVETEVKGSSKNDQDFDDTINSSLVEYTMRNVISLEWNK